MDNDPPRLTLAQIDAILAFLPIFEQPGYSFGTWHAPEGVFPFWDPSAEVQAFTQTLYDQQFITPFDWVAWSSEAQRYIDGGDDAFASADLDILRKLITSFMRADRFSEGTLATMFQGGQITAVLRRLRQIRATMAST